MVRRTVSPAEYALEVARMRLAFAALMFVIAYVAIAGRLADLTVFGDERDTSVLSQSQESTLSASRADVVDRNGMVLATSVPMYSLCADTRRIMDMDEAAKKLLTVLPDLDRKKLDADLRGGGRCEMIRRKVTPQQYYAINKLGIAGMEFGHDEGRAWPAGRLGAHIVGFTDVDGNGTAGVEKGQNSRLQHRHEPLRLTIDLRLQTVLRTELAAAIKEFSADGGAGLIMDVTNGEILGMSSLPDFDPQDAGRAGDASKFNRAALGVYEMGSTFKIFNTALALESGQITPYDRFDTVSELKVGGRTIRDFHPATRWLNVIEIFEESSNIGSARMADRIGEEAQRAFLEKLGLLEKPKIGLPEMGAPIVPSSTAWGQSTTMTVAFGHGIAVNSVQLAAAVSTVINGGKRVFPTVVFPEDSDGEDEAKVEEKRVVSQRTSDRIRAMMRLVITRGTAKAAEVPGYLMGGKTGTADKASARGYNDKARLSSFIGAFPMNSPRYLVFVMLDDPKANESTHGFATGGWTAAPTVARIVEKMAPMLGIAPMSEAEGAAAERGLLKALGM